MVVVVAVGGGGGGGLKTSKPLAGTAFSSVGSTVSLLRVSYGGIGGAWGRSCLSLFTHTHTHTGHWEWRRGQRGHVMG